MGALRVKAVLEGLGIGPSELERRYGMSKTTWCRFLAGGREIKGRDPWGDVARLLQERGLPVTPDLFNPERDGAEPSLEARMQGQYLSEAARKHFKLFRDPFVPSAMTKKLPGGGMELQDLFLPASHRFIEERLRQAAMSAGFIALTGEPGSGKSTLLSSALRRASDVTSVVRVSPANIERRKLTAAHIAAEIIRQLSEEPVPRMANTRDSKAQEVLVQRYEEGQRVALVIDEAHELPHDTIKDLKRYHELSYGFAQLLAVILVGQTELRARFDAERNYRLREAIIRCQLVTLPPMKGHTADYIARRFEWVEHDVTTVFDLDGLEALEARLGVHEQQYPVLIGNAAVAAMNVAARRGVERVTDEEVDAVWASTADQLMELGL